MVERDTVVHGECLENGGLVDGGVDESLEAEPETLLAWPLEVGFDDEGLEAGVGGGVAERVRGEVSVPEGFALVRGFGGVDDDVAPESGELDVKVALGRERVGYLEGEGVVSFDVFELRSVLHRQIDSLNVALLQVGDGREVALVNEEAVGMSGSKSEVARGTESAGVALEIGVFGSDNFDSEYRVGGDVGSRRSEDNHLVGGNDAGSLIEVLGRSDLAFGGRRT